MNNTKPSISIRTCADVIDAVPYLLGFTPTDSLVLLVTDGRQLIVTARLDLPRKLIDPDFIDTMERIKQRWPDASIIAISYAPRFADERVAYARAVTSVHLSSNVDRWIEADDGIQAWRDADNPADNGRLDAVGVTAVTIAVETGLAPVSDRDAFMQGFTAGTETDPDLAALALEVVDGLDESPIAMAVYIAGAEDPRVVRDLWLGVLRSCPADRAGKVYSLVALLSWGIGDGAAAQVCASRADGPLAEIAQNLIDSPFDPREEWDSIRAMFASTLNEVMSS